MFVKFDKEFRFVNGSPTDIKMRLEAGVYNVRIVDEGMRGSFIQFEKTERYKNSKILDAGVFKKVENNLNDFMSEEMFEARKAVKALNKIGLLFTGDPGTGKTFLAGQIGQKIADSHDAIAIMTNNFSEYNLPKLVDTLRESEPDRFIVVIMDEFEKCDEWKLRDGSLLAYLDGNTSRDNVINLALVNATSNMKDYLLKRPGRFEQVYNFDEEDDTVLKALIECLTPKEYVERVDSTYLAKQLIEEKKRTVDAITIAVRDSIAEVIYFDKYKVFKTFSSLKYHDKKKEKIGFKTPKIEKEEIKESDKKVTALKTIQFPN